MITGERQRNIKKNLKNHNERDECVPKSTINVIRVNYKSNELTGHRINE